MAVYVFDGDARPGHRFCLDEFADREFTVWEECRDAAIEVEAVLRRRYPEARLRVYATPKVAVDGARAKQARIRRRYGKS
jgi:hypothetical protein